MGLQIKHNRAEHTHENEQFRRIAHSLKLLFDMQKWDGILIGNPYNENYSHEQSLVTEVIWFIRLDKFSIIFLETLESIVNDIFKVGLLR